MDKSAVFFTDFLTVLIKNKSEDDDILIRSFIEEKCALCHEGVEPASGLVNSF